MNSFYVMKLTIIVSIGEYSHDVECQSQKEADRMLTIGRYYPSETDAGQKTHGHWGHLGEGRE